MQRIRYWIRNFFGFSHAETNGFLVLLPLMTVIAFLPLLYKQFFISEAGNRLEQQQNALLDSLVANWDFNPPTKKPITIPIARFAFNPNTAPKEALQRLGLAPYLAQRIINYRLKGGTFNKPSDMLKIYGMDSSWYSDVHAFINIPTRNTRNRGKSPTKRTVYRAEQSPLDLNTADTTVLQTISGIGPVLAARIIKYKNALGGFVNEEQLHEVYGLDTGVIRAVAKRAFITSHFVPQQVSINDSTGKLAQHPYMTYRLARVIRAYRFQHGMFKTIDDLLKIHVIDSAFLHKIRPYIKL